MSPAGGETPESFTLKFLHAMGIPLKESLIEKMERAVAQRAGDQGSQ